MSVQLQYGWHVVQVVLVRRSEGCNAICESTASQSRGEKGVWLAASDGVWHPRGDMQAVCGGVWARQYRGSQT